jgi:hypothetical protein
VTRFFIRSYIRLPRNRARSMRAGSPVCRHGQSSGLAAVARVRSGSGKGVAMQRTDGTVQGTKPPSPTHFEIVVNGHGHNKPDPMETLRSK